MKCNMAEVEIKEFDLYVIFLSVRQIAVKG